MTRSPAPVSGPGRELLHRPAVAVRVAEEHERAPVEDLDIAHVDAAAGQLRAGRIDVGDDELEPFDGAGRHRAEPGADRDRCGRAGRRELNEPHPAAGLGVDVEMEARVLGVERDRALDVGDGYLHELEPELHAPERTWQDWVVMEDALNIDVSVPPSGPGCADCESAGGWWLHLRRCAACGHIGCCDSSPAQHATAHWRGTGHPLVQSYEPGEDWYWDYRTQEAYRGRGTGRCCRVRAGPQRCSTGSPRPAGSSRTSPSP